MSQPATVPAAAEEVKVTFKLASGSAKGKETDWTPAGIFKADLRAGGAITLDARVEGRDAKGQPVPIVAEWQPADHGSVQVTPTATGVVRITVRGRGESNVTVVGPGFSKELWLSATTQGDTVQLQVSQ